MRCDQCRHWRTPTSYGPWGICEEMAISTEYRRPGSSKAWTTPDEIDGPSSFCTMPSFGCTLFEAKPKEPKPLKARSYKPGKSDEIFRRIQAGQTFQQLADEIGMTNPGVRAAWVGAAIREMQRTGELVVYHAAIGGGQWPPHPIYWNGNIPPKIQLIFEQQGLSGQQERNDDDLF